MKKISYLVFSLFFSIFFVNNVSASNKIYNIDVNIYINQDGSANVIENWKMKVDNGTEVYKPISNLGNMQLSNFKVVDENGNIYSKINSWNVDSSFSQKAYKSGINYTSDGMELCWGMSSYGTHTYTISYNLSNFIFNTSDAQTAYYKAINDNIDPAPDNFSIYITSFYSFPDTLDVWGYGYDGYAYVKDGKIELANKTDNFKSSEYAVVLIKFPLNTFNNTSSYSKYSDFDSVLNTAKKGSTSSSNKNNFSSIINAIGPMIFYIFLAFIGTISYAKVNKNKNKYKFETDNGKINKNEINNFRDLPKNKDLYRVNEIIKIYSNTKDSNIIGAILLNWILYDKVSVVKLPDKVFRKNRVSIDLKDNIDTNNEIEQELYIMLKKASKDNFLEDYELDNWSKNNYQKLFNWLNRLDEKENDKLVEEGFLFKEKGFLNNYYIVKDVLKEDGLKILGLKKFLEEFSNIGDKEAIEVKLWKEYLIYAEIFGIADKVAKQFKNIIPDIKEFNEYDFDMLIYNINMINLMTINSMNAADRAREAAANSYHGGGGGFSSFGGGGGSFGGGSGGGCR